MKQDALNLIWIDLEMTGLDTQNDLIIEIATVVTDQNLNLLAQGPNLAVHQSVEVLDAMDEWNRTHHGQSGLIESVLQSQFTEAEAEEQTLAFLSEWVPEGQSPMCGNSIGQDRRFLHRCMPTLEAYFHYRNLDVSTLKELARRWAPGLLDGFEKETAHRALGDVLESIDELKFYREHFIREF